MNLIFCLILLVKECFEIFLFLIYVFNKLLVGNLNAVIKIICVFKNNFVLLLKHCCVKILNRKRYNFKLVTTTDTVTKLKK